MQGYLDHNATTPLDERVLESMMPYLTGRFGNPSSVHRIGSTAREAIEQAREQVASLVGAHPSQVIFTSGGTEANNLALKGITAMEHGGHIAVSAVEHASVLGPAQALARQGWQVDILPVNGNGQLTAEQVDERITSDTRLVSVMMANNETGVLQDVSAIAEVARRNGAVMHTDAVQALGKLEVDFARSGAHLMTLSAHKIYGPKGIGALIVDKSLQLEPLIHGGGQEKGRRCGTENVAAIVGFGAATALAREELQSRRNHVLALREQFEKRLAEQFPAAVIFAKNAERLPNTSFFTLPGIDGETLLMLLDNNGFAVSSGSACESKSPEPSHVLMAMDVSQEVAQGAVRVSFGQANSSADVDAVLSVLAMQMRALNSGAASGWD